MLADHDFHPDEPTVRIFRTSSPGVLRLDDSVAISEAVYGGVVLRHYAFADHWFKINVTTDLSGRVIETGDGNHQFAFNCDIATPMEREGSSTFGVDLFTDVLVRESAMSYAIVDQDEFGDMLGRGLLSPAEGRGAQSGLRELLDLVDEGRLLRWLGELARSGRASLPARSQCETARYRAACGQEPAGPGDPHGPAGNRPRGGQARTTGSGMRCPAVSGAMRTHSASAAVLSAASDLASVTKPATRVSATLYQANRPARRTWT